MKDQDNKNREFTANQTSAGEGAAEKEERDNKGQQAESEKYKENPDQQTGSHREGQYDRQSDDATMHPSSIDEDK